MWQLIIQEEIEPYQTFQDIFTGHALDFQSRILCAPVNSANEASLPELNKDSWSPFLSQTSLGRASVWISLDLDDEQEGSAGSDTLGDDLNDSSDEDGVERVSDRLVNISFCYDHGLGVKSSQLLSAS